MTLSPKPKLVVRGLHKEFAGKPAPTQALGGIDLHVDQGEFVCLVGASGCGKSTLLSIVAGLEEPTAGELTLDGRPIVGPGPDRGLVFQGYSLFPWRTVAQNVTFGLEVNGVNRFDMNARVDYYLDVMHLTEWRDALPHQLSGGMRQRVAIARSLATEPEMLLLDEPLGALDAQTRSRMQDFLLEVWARTGTTVLMVTHDVEEALFLAQRVYVLSSRPGRIKKEVLVPFGADRESSIRRDAAFLDLRDAIQASLLAEVAPI